MAASSFRSYLLRFGSLVFTLGVGLGFGVGLGDDVELEDDPPGGGRIFRCVEEPMSPPVAFRPELVPAWPNAMDGNKNAMITMLARITYLINSPMLPQLKRDADGGLTLIVQTESPGNDKEANWLPAPKGPFSMIMRLYWPKDEAVEGKWTAPPLNRMT